MKVTLSALSLVCMILGASCVESPDTTDTQPQELATCSSNLIPAKWEVMPAEANWTQVIGALPPDASIDQAWIVTAKTQNPQGEWLLHQVDLVNKRVSFTARFTSAQRPAIYAMIASKNQAIGGIRVPPGPIGPGGTEWSQVKFLVQLGDRVRY